MQAPTSNNVIQVGNKNHTVIQHSGHQLIVGKIDESGTITIHDGDTSTAQTIQTIYPNHYVDHSTTDQSLYSPPNSHMQYQDYGSVIYTVGENGTYYHPNTAQIISNNQNQDQSICIQSSSDPSFLNASSSLNISRNGNSNSSSNGADNISNTYLIQGQSLMGEDDQTNSLSHTAKASPVTVNWLISNYETADGVSLPRSTLYFHYLQHCHEHKLEPMNPASFGKLIRSVFLGLRTRRLGTRGNSKYHYYGIRIKPTSHLNHYIEENSFQNRTYNSNYSRNGTCSLENNDWKVNASETSYYTGSCSSSINNNNNCITDQGLQNYNENIVTSSTGCNPEQNTLKPSFNSTSSNHANYLGEANSTLPNLEDICIACDLPIPPNSGNCEIYNNFFEEYPDDELSRDSEAVKESETINDNDIIEFVQIYANSAADMLSAVVNLDFNSISSVWKMFWKTDDIKDENSNKKLRQKLTQLVDMPEIQQFIRLYDHTFYQSLAEVLIPNVLRPIPPTLTQAIRNFAKSLEGWMRSALQDLDPVLIHIKVSAVCALAQTLRRYTSLNHLAQAARAVLKNISQMTQMLSDFNRIDLNNIQEQASWICFCPDATVNQIFQDFKKILGKHVSLEEWAQWLDSVVNQVLEPSENNSQTFTKAAHQLMLKWSFYSSMVIRDLTLRSAASFGSFHLIRLLFDEYIFYLIEHKVAGHWGMTPVAVMGEIGRSMIKERISSINASLKRSLNNIENPLKPGIKNSSSNNKGSSQSIPNKIRKIFPSNTPTNVSIQATSNSTSITNTSSLGPIRQVCVKKSTANGSNIHVFTTTSANFPVKRYVQPINAKDGSEQSSITNSNGESEKSINASEKFLKVDQNCQNLKRYESQDDNEEEEEDGDEDEYEDENSEEHSMLLQAASRLREQMGSAEKPIDICDENKNASPSEKIDSNKEGHEATLSLHYEKDENTLGQEITT